MKQARLSIIFCVLCVTASVPSLAAKHQFRYTSVFRPFANRFYFLPLDFNASPQELSAASTHKLAFLAGLRLLRFTETDTSKVKDSLRYFEPNRSVYFTPPSVYRGTGLMSGPRVSKNPLPPGYEVLMRLDSSSTVRLQKVLVESSNSDIGITTVVPVVQQNNGQLAELNSISKLTKEETQQHMLTEHHE